MDLDLVGVATASFRTDDDSDTKADSHIRSRLGLDARYVAARLAIARSLSIATDPEAAPSLDGRTIKGDTLFGTGVELATWIALIVERTNATTLRELQLAVGAHWRRGVHVLTQELEEAGGDEAVFWPRLAESAGLPAFGATSRPTGRPEAQAEAKPIEIALNLGIDTETNDEVSWSMNAPGGAPHMAIMGAPGKGKTRTAVALISQILERVQVPVLAFDLKGDLARDYKLDSSTSGTVLSPPRSSVPLDIFAAAAEMSNIDLGLIAERFKDSFTRLKAGTVGARQSEAIREATEIALATGMREKKKVSLTEVHKALKQVYAQKEMREDGATARMSDLARYEIFKPELNPSDFFNRSWIVTTPPDVPEVIRDVTVNLLLDSLDRWLNALPDSPIENGYRALRHILLLDEAHLVLDRKLPSLDRLVRLSRSKGGVTILLSQKPDDFTSAGEEFISNMGLVMAFGSNASDEPIRRVFGRRLDLAGFSAGVCAVRTGGAQTRLVKAWNS